MAEKFSPIVQDVLSIFQNDYEKVSPSDALPSSPFVIAERPSASGDLSVESPDNKDDEHRFEFCQEPESLEQHDQEVMNPRPLEPVDLFIADQYEIDLSARLRYLRARASATLQPKLPDALRVIIKEQLERIQEVRRDLKAFRGRPHGRPGPVDGPQPPCVRCFAKQMHCSLEFEDTPDKISRCTRCERNNVENCIKQMVAVGRSTHGIFEAPGRSKSTTRYELAGSPTPKLVEEAENMLEGKSRVVLGIMLSADVCKSLGLPRWHDNDQPEKKLDPNFRPRNWKDQLLERKEEILVEIRRQVDNLERQLVMHEVLSEEMVE